MKVTIITAKENLLDQLSKDIHMDTIDAILKHFKNHPQQGDDGSWTESDHNMQTNESPFSGSESKCTEAPSDVNVYVETHNAVKLEDSQIIPLISNWGRKREVEKQHRQ